MKRREILRRLSLIGVGAIGTSLAGCSGYFTNFRPEVKLVNLRLIEAEGVSLRLGVDLSVINTGPVTIPVDGLAWYVSLEGSEVLSGVTNEIAPLEPYTEVPLSLEATTNLTGMISLFNRLLNPADDQFEYELKTRIGLSGLRLPVEYVDRGSINLSR